MHSDHVCKRDFKNGFSDPLKRQKAKGLGRKGDGERGDCRRRLHYLPSAQFQGASSTPSILWGRGFRIGTAKVVFSLLEEEVGTLARWWGAAEADGRSWWEGGPRCSHDFCSRHSRLPVLSLLPSFLVYPFPFSTGPSSRFPCPLPPLHSPSQIFVSLLSSRDVGEGGGSWVLIPALVQNEGFRKLGLLCSLCSLPSSLLQGPFDKAQVRS